MSREQKGSMVLRFANGILDNEAYKSLKDRAASFSTDYRILVVRVKEDDADTLSEMVTSAAMFVDAALTAAIPNDENTMHMMKKTAVASRRIVSQFKEVRQIGSDKTESDCRFSIVTPSAHIHLPQNVSDKKYERCVRECLLCACRLEKEGAHDMLVLCDDDGTIRSISKAEYVRLTYGDRIQTEPNAEKSEEYFTKT